MSDINKIVKFADVYEDAASLEGFLWGKPPQESVQQKPQIIKDPQQNSNSIRNAVVQIADSQVGETDWEKYLQGTVLETPNKKPAWCGLFALWTLHQAGVATGLMWEWGKGFLYKLPMTSNPKPGDMAYIDQPYQHHAIVKSVNGDQITTIDGNSPGSVVAERTRPKGSIAFFSIAPIIGEEESIV